MTGSEDRIPGFVRIEEEGLEVGAECGRKNREDIFGREGCERLRLVEDGPWCGEVLVGKRRLVCLPGRRSVRVGII